MNNSNSMTTKIPQMGGRRLNRDQGVPPVESSTSDERRRPPYCADMSVEDILAIFNVPQDGATCKNRSDEAFEAVSHNHGDFSESDIYFSPFYTAQQTTPAGKTLVDARSSRYSQKPIPTGCPETCGMSNQDFEPSRHRYKEAHLQTRNHSPDEPPTARNEPPRPCQAQEIPRNAHLKEQYSTPRQSFNNETFSSWRPSGQYDHRAALGSRAESAQIYSTGSRPPTRQQDGDRFAWDSRESFVSERVQISYPTEQFQSPPGLSHPMSRAPQGPGNYPEDRFYGLPPITQDIRHRQNNNLRRNPRPSPAFMSTHPTSRNIDPNASSWGQVYRIYGTAIAILLKSINFSAQSQANSPENKSSQDPNNSFYIDNFFEQYGLPRSTHNLLRLYNTDVNFQRHGEIVMGGEMRRKELKTMIKTGVEAKFWPGDVEFSELRQGLETVRRKSLVLLEDYGKWFDKEWEIYRSRR